MFPEEFKIQQKRKGCGTFGFRARNNYSNLLRAEMGNRNSDSEGLSHSALAFLVLTPDSPAYTHTHLHRNTHTDKAVHQRDTD